MYILPIFFYFFLFLVNLSLLRKSDRLQKSALTRAENTTKIDHMINCLRNGLDEGVMEINAGDVLKRGVAATRSFVKGDFVLEYQGEYLPSKSAYEARLNAYIEDNVPGSFFMSFKHGDKWRW